MALRDEILPYIDGNGLVAPNEVGPGAIRGSDNGPLYTSEFFDILAKSKELTDQDRADFSAKIESCISEGLLNRAPADPDQEGPDDYYGVLGACQSLGNTDIPRKLLKGVVTHWGFLNNVDGTKTWQSFLIRQPQLLASMIAAAFPSWNPVHILIRLLAMPLFLVAAVSIAISCIRKDTSQADPRRLSWHLIQSVAPVSLMCWLASKIWFRRLYRDYGPKGMKAVADVYYQPGHPFIKYWVD